MKKILIYLGDFQDKKTKLKSLLDSINIPYRFLNNEDLNCTIQYLLDENTSPNIHTTDHYSIDLMFFDEISDEEILMLNKKMQECGIAMPRKAMRTKHNETWLLKDLLAEIEKEHNYFLILENIQRILQESANLIIEDYTKDSWKIYENAFYHAYHVLQNRSNYEIAKQALEQLLYAKDHLIKHS